MQTYSNHWKTCKIYATISTSLHSTIKQRIDLNVALKIFLTLPVAKSEYSFSKLKLIKTYIYSIMFQKRPVSLVAMWQLNLSRLIGLNWLQNLKRKWNTKWDFNSNNLQDWSYIFNLFFVCFSYDKKLYIIVTRLVGYNNSHKYILISSKVFASQFFFFVIRER